MEKHNKTWKPGKFQLEIRYKFLAVIVVNHWKKLPKESGGFSNS